MFNRKGVSEVVANVLIVLLVIVGIAVIWSVVKPTIERTADTVQSDCFTVQVEPQSCVLSAAATALGNCVNTNLCTTAPTGSVAQSACPSECTWTETVPVAVLGATATVNIKRNPGAGNFENIEVVFESATGTIERIASGITSTGTNPFEELETITTSALDPAFVPANANIVLRTNGQLCQITTQAANCA
ncbi:MAG: hypothetical protein AABY16_01260 [Nanoarchaeota archaeon]